MLRTKHSDLSYDQLRVCSLEVSHFVRWNHHVQIQWKYFIQILLHSYVSHKYHLRMLWNLCVGWNGIPMKVFFNKVWLCDCTVWIEDVLVYNLVVVSLYSLYVLTCLVSILFILLRVCNAQNVNFFCILVLLDIHFLQTLV